MFTCRFCFHWAITSSPDSVAVYSLLKVVLWNFVWFFLDSWFWGRRCYYVCAVFLLSWSFNLVQFSFGSNITEYIHVIHVGSMSRVHLLHILSPFKYARKIPAWHISCHYQQLGIERYHVSFHEGFPCLSYTGTS